MDGAADEVEESGSQRYGKKEKRGHIFGRRTIKGNRT
jgi:tRNA(Glu) U13 pseudouridine synthase TruD